MVCDLTSHKRAFDPHKQGKQHESRLMFHRGYQALRNGLGALKSCCCGPVIAVNEHGVFISLRENMGRYIFRKDDLRYTSIIVRYGSMVSNNGR